MIRKALQLTLAASFLLSAPAAFAHEHHGCSARNVAGDWAYSGTGVRNGVGPVAAVGRYTLDVEGNSVGQQTVSFNGVVVEETWTGTNTLNEEDCTGTLTVVVSSPIAPRTSHLNYVYADDGNEVLAIFTDAGTILTTQGKKIY
jgi:hypothetical protein